jgi:hypothetical protein
VTNGADEDSMLDRENGQDDEHESEEAVDETVNVLTPRRRTRRQGKNRVFIIPDAVTPSDDLEDESPTSKGRISRIKKRPKYLRSIQDQFPKSPQQRKATRGRGLA